MQSFIFGGLLAKQKLEDYRGAIQDYSQAITIDPYYVNAYLFRGVAKAMLSSYYEALQDFSKVINMDSYNANAYFYSGLAKSGLGNKEGACYDFSKSGQLGKAEAYDMIQQVCN